jgi:hypothetical protein
MFRTERRANSCDWYWRESCFPANLLDNQVSEDTVHVCELGESGGRAVFGSQDQ